MSPSATFAARLGRDAPVDEPVAVVIAHPDDEVLWTGTALLRLRRAVLVHLTDGAPADMGDAARLGFEAREDYAVARAAETKRALTALGASPERLSYGVPDQQAIDRLDEIVDRLATDLRGVAAILTHPYEGGHPDHDAAALAVRLAADRIGNPALVEFACYHARGGERRFGEFWPDPDQPEVVRPLSAAERERVTEAIGEHRTQAAVIAGWRPRVERWRPAPAYDFTAPPPPEECLYDGFGWATTSSRWRERAAAWA